MQDGKLMCTAYKDGSAWADQVTQACSGLETSSALSVAYFF